MLPILNVNIKKLEHNYRSVINSCHYHGLQVAAVTKCASSNPVIVKSAIKCGADQIADSRIENLAKLGYIGVPRMLIRVGGLSEVWQIVNNCEISLASEIRTIRALSEASSQIHKTHKVILMIDLGDLREGIPIHDEEIIMATVENILQLDSIVLYGIGSNFSCLSGLLPDNEKLSALVLLAEKIRKKYSIELPIVSGGATSTYSFLQKAGFVEGINHLRIGECCLFGYDTSNDCPCGDLFSDVFHVDAELIEVSKKNVRLEGHFGLDAFGRKPAVDDIDRIMRRGICALGLADTSIDSIFPIDDNIHIIGACSDQTVLDLSSAPTYSIGDVVRFNLRYSSLMHLSFPQRCKWCFEA